MPDDISIQTRYVHELSSAVMSKIERLPTDDCCLAVIAAIEAIANLTSKDVRSRAIANGKGPDYAENRISQYNDVFVSAAKQAVATNNQPLRTNVTPENTPFDVDVWIDDIRHTVITKLTLLPVSDRDLVMISAVEAAANVAAMEAIRHSLDNGKSEQDTLLRINEYAKVFTEGTQRPKPDEWVRF